LRYQALTNVLNAAASDKALTRDDGPVETAGRTLQRTNNKHYAR
jgi:hypothetical protein